MSKIVIDKANRSDLERILEIYAHARAYMAQNGNASQWGNGYPEKTLLKSDIQKGELYVMKEKGRIFGVFAFIIGADPTYDIIEDGAWFSSDLYGTIHRIASDGSVRGVLDAAVLFCETKIKHLRIDTHENNKIMQYLIEKNGFKKCGRIYADDGTPRIAYEKFL